MGHDTETNDDHVLRVVPANEYRRVRWKNGCGWTREAAQGRLAPGPGVHALAAESVPGNSPCDGDGDHDGRGAGDAWDWRLSIAEIDEDAAYSSFPGVDREQMLLSGNGLRLRLGEHVETLMPPHDRHVFPGEAPVFAELVDGRVQAINLMWRRGRVALQSWFRPLVGPMLVFTDPAETWVLHLVSGHARLDRTHALPRLEAGDTVVLQGLGQRRRCMIEGAGSVLLARIAPTAADGEMGAMSSAMPQ
ncbi:HutD/Ves family protein [Marilutibacter aestuarii]|uniref:HutD family protein n=1 Tax=Marilutibacter aestuarii TaxID=1706195 RepID=A0A508AE53_9GAMM|nr:HutD family protein [Lysobacter aestuarii]TQD48280.1 HutD family protein [Lysobacter aestuarii]